MSNEQLYHPPPPSYHTSEWKLLSQGAEARIWIVPALAATASGTDDDADLNEVVICKERFPKSYRIEQLDRQITKSRIKAEARCLTRCRRNGIFCPALLAVDVRKGCLFMEYLNGCPVRQFLTQNAEHVGELETNRCRRDDDPSPASKRPRADSMNETVSEINSKKTASMKVAYHMGALIAQAHNAHVIHGDLTTSNVILTNPPSRNDKIEGWTPLLALIDFGLSGLKPKSAHEDMAVDLYVLERSFTSTHPGSEDLVEEMFRAYKREGKTSDSVLARLFDVRLRGRKRDCFG